jgi:hypothetical protein
MDTTSASFENLSNALNTSFSADDSFQEVQKAMIDIENRKQIILSKINDKKNEIFRDENYLEFELKTLILESRSVLQKLSSDIKIGSEARMYEVYAKLLEAITKQYTEIREINRMIFDMNKDTEEGSKSKAPKFEFDSNQLLDFVDKVRKNNLMNDIKVDFKVENVGDK